MIQTFLQRCKSSGSLRYDRFATYDEIVEYLESCDGRLEEVGVSEERRRILAIRVGEGPVTCVLEAGAHAREWASPMAAIYVIGQLLKSKDLGVSWIIVPLLNPDGYEYSRKRQGEGTQLILTYNHVPSIYISSTVPSPVAVTSLISLELSGCSRDPCSETYSGPEAWSEAESRAMRDLVLREKNVRAYLSVHSCLQAIMYPPAYSTNPPTDLDNLLSIAQEAQGNILRTCGRLYRVGQSSRIDRPASGASIDWARETAKVQYAFNIELPGPETGFILEENQVEQVGKELFEIIKVMSKVARENSRLQ